MGYLEIVVPPDIIDEDSSGDIMVPEGGTVELTCRARGYPDPEITWKREDRQEIVFREASGIRNKVRVHEGSTLRLPRISRSDMGHYMCMASNGVPPAVSKRISINVHFPPVIQVPNQLVGAPLGTDVNLECYVEASPKAIIYWMRDSSDTMIVTSDKYETKVSVRSIFETKMTLKVHHLQKADVGTYRCIAKNSLGEVERSIRLYEIPGSVTRKAPSTAIVLTEDQEEEDQEEEEEVGSAEKGLPETPPPRRHHDHHTRANLDEAPPAAASARPHLVPHRLLALLALASRSF